MYTEKKYFYRVYLCEVYDDKNVQDICGETSFDFEELREAQKFAITCMKHNEYCVANVQPLEIKKYYKKMN